MTANNTQIIPAGYMEPNDEKLEKEFADLSNIKLVCKQETISAWRDSFTIASIIAFIFGFGIFTYAYNINGFVPAKGDSISLFTMLLILSIVMFCIGIPSAFVLNKKSLSMLAELNRRSRVRMSKFCPTVKPAAPVFSIYDKIALPEDVYVDDSDNALFDIVDSIYKQDEEFSRIVDAMMNDDNLIDYESLSTEEKSVVDKIQTGEDITDAEKELYLLLMNKAFGEDGIAGIISRICTDEDVAIVEKDSDDTNLVEEIKDDEDEVCVSAVNPSRPHNHSPRYVRKIYSTGHQRWRKYSKIPRRVNKTKLLHKQIKRRRRK